MFNVSSGVLLGARGNKNVKGALPSGIRLDKRSEIFEKRAL